ncbi:DUF423 domain-containing protein [Sphingobacterium sp. Mn56C]|uniref:DUF423 domain-containing protein n=1 Tax=Sphingobacterium sp. Mn56C TaxID=3395261 RepID=UPI003BE4AE11
MQTFTLATAAIFAMTAIILGAFGAHAFKKILSEEKLTSFETGVKYQMYSALALLIIGFNIDFNLYNARFAVYSIVLGTLLFSVSIYFLSFADYWKKNFRFLGPITPLGGLLMIIGWAALLVNFLK